MEVTPAKEVHERTERPVSPAKAEEQAMLVGVGPEAPDASGNLPMLDELAELARTAGARVMGRMWQRRERPEAATYLGSGKLEELKALCTECGANLVVADTDLSPAQVRQMEEALNLRVVDRSELIIDIFAQHARTRQSALQVELAQLQYLSPRLKRMWTHLSRITGTGGIGSRGPGEKQIEVDRRLIQKRLQVLREELAEIESRRGRQAQGRPGVFKVALVGYTNAGKSTLMRALTGADVLVEDKLFATLDTRTRKWDLGRGADVLLSDTVGFIEKLPHHLVASFHATLEEVRCADLLLHVVNGADPDAERRSKSVRSVLRDIGADFVPELVVLNKIDMLQPVEAEILAKRVDAAVLVSATRGTGMDILADLVRAQAGARLKVTRLRVPVTDGRTLAMLAARARIIEQAYEGETCVLTAALTDELRAKLSIYVQEAEA
ncbi:MAG: GTPase HflX [Planctomycetes bacterium]|nr:GTPase HflX [Planctomycetota bacterium]